MNEENPYASPSVDAEVIGNPYGDKGSSGVGLWRKGNQLIMHKMAQLPNICVKTGSTAERRIRKKLQWHHPALILLIFAGLLIYLIVALIVMKRATIEVPVSHDWMSKRLKRIMIALAVFLLGASIVGLGIYGVSTESLSDDVLAICFFAGCLLALGGLITAAIVARIVWPAKITDTHVYLSGVHPDVLATLDVWPYD